MARAIFAGGKFGENRSGFQPFGFVLADYLGRPTPADKKTSAGDPGFAPGWYGERLRRWLRVNSCSTEQCAKLIRDPKFGGR
jgi:hypothetical protein